MPQEAEEGEALMPCIHDMSMLVRCPACEAMRAAGVPDAPVEDARLTAALERVKQLEKALEDSNPLLRELGQALASPFPGEDMAIAQLKMGDSLIEKSIKRRLLNLKLLSEKE
jgi:hypothetical protein